MYRVELSKRALRDLRRIDYKSRKRLLDLLEGNLGSEPAGYASVSNRWGRIKPYLAMTSVRLRPAALAA